MPTYDQFPSLAQLIDTAHKLRKSGKLPTTSFYQEVFMTLEMFSFDFHHASVALELIDVIAVFDNPADLVALSFWKAILVQAALIATRFIRDKAVLAPTLAKHYRWLGATPRHEGDYFDALRFFFESPQFSDFNDPVWVMAHYAIGRDLIGKRSYEQENQIAESLLVAAAGFDLIAYMYTCVFTARIGAVYRYPERTFTYGQQCLIIARHLNLPAMQRAGILLAANTAIRIMFSTGKTTMLERYIKLWKSLDTYSIVPKRDAIFKTILWQLHYFRKDYETAAELAEDALYIFGYLKDYLNLCLMQISLAMCYVRMGRLPSAVYLSNEAFELADQHKFAEYQAKARYIHAWALHKSREYEKSKLFFENALEYGLKLGASNVKQTMVNNILGDFADLVTDLYKLKIGYDDSIDDTYRLVQRLHRFSNAKKLQIALGIYIKWATE